MKILKELFHGTLSLTILAVIMLLYFSNFNGMPSVIQYGSFKDMTFETRGNTMTGYAISALDAGNGLFNLSCQFNNPTEKTIILRMDDVQEYAWSKATMNITDTVLDRNMSITLGIIPNRFNDTNRNAPMRNYLLSKAGNSNIELAQHGTNHNEREYLNLSESETYNLTKAGYENIVKTFGVYPVTFIPPNNEYHENTTKTHSKLSFAILSAKQDEYKFDGYAMHIGFTAQTKYSNKNELNPISGIINSCKTSLESKNICVIVIHPQDYVNNDKITINETRHAEFIELLDELQKLDSKHATFKDLIKCDNP